MEGLQKCKGNINNFCNVCGHFIPSDKYVPAKRKGAISEEFIATYEAYFNQPLIHNVTWAPNAVCIICYNALLKWKKKERKSLPFGNPMIWTDPGLHDEENCYACANSVSRLNAKKAQMREYVGVRSVQLPIPHSENIPIQKPPSPDRETVETGATAETTTSQETENYSVYQPEESTSNEPSTSRKEPILITQKELDYMVSKLELTQRKSEELASFLKRKNVLVDGVKVTAYRKRQLFFQQFYTANEDGSFAYCNDVEKLMNAIGIKYKADEWRIFIDAAKFHLKAVLLHQANKKPSIPIALCSDTKETYQKMKLILEKVKYQEHQWRVCCDLKVVSMLCGLQGGYVKYMCFLCDWDSRCKDNSYQVYSWQDRSLSDRGQANMINEPLVPREQIALPYLHVKLGIVKSLITTLVEKNQVPGRGKIILDCLKDIFRNKITEKKLKKGTFIRIFNISLCHYRFYQLIFTFILFCQARSTVRIFGPS